MVIFYIMLNTLQLLLPALIPSWRFFDVIAPSPRIEFGLMHTAQDTPDYWQEFRPRPAHLPFGAMLKGMVWNPRWNESLFLVSCAERLMDYPTEHNRLEIANRIRRELASNHPPGSHFQFRLGFVNRSGTQLEKNITYISPTYALSG